MQNKTFVTHFVTLSNINKIFPLLQGLNKNSAIASIVIPHSASWCQRDIAVEDRNTVTISKDYIANYCKNMNITERTFKKMLKELQPIILRLKKNTKDVYYVNPFWAAHGSNDEIKEFRYYCVKNRIFIPFSMFGKICKSTAPELYDTLYENTRGAELLEFIEQTDKNEQELQSALDAEPLSHKHSCLYTNIATVSHYSAFCEAKLSTTEVLFFIMLSSMCNFVKSPNVFDINNVVTLSVKEQERLAEKIGIKDRALRDCLKKMTELSILHKIDRENGKYMINPFLTAKGEQSKIILLQNRLEKNKNFFDGHAAGDVMIKEVKQ